MSDFVEPHSYEIFAAIELFKARRENVADGSLYHHSKTAFGHLIKLSPKNFETVIRFLRLAHETYQTEENTRQVSDTD